MKVVITGGTGFLGSHVSGMLLDRGHSVSALGRLSGNLLDPIIADGLIKGADIVIHLAANVGGVGYLDNNKARSFYDNLTLGINVTNACSKHRVKRLILAGTPCVYGDSLKLPLSEADISLDIPSGPVAGYAFAKLAVSSLANEICSQNGIDSVTFIPSNMYGPRDHFEQHKSHVGAALLRKAYIAHHKSLSTFEVWGDGSATRDFVYVGDVAASIVKLVEYGHKLNGATLNFGSGVETKIGEFAELLCKLLESKVKPDYQTERPIGYQRRVLSCSRAREILGHNPQLELEDGLKNTLQWIKDTRQVDNWLKE